MKKVFLIKQEEIDELRRHVNAIMYIMESAKKGDMSESQALDGIKIHAICLDSELDVR